MYHLFFSFCLKFHPHMCPAYPNLLTWPMTTEQIQSLSVYQGCARFAEILSELTKTWSSGATECGVWIGNCNVKVWKSTEHKLHNIWRSLKFQQNEHTPGKQYLKSISVIISLQLLKFWMLKDQNSIVKLYYLRKHLSFFSGIFLSSSSLSENYTMPNLK